MKERIFVTAGTQLPFERMLGWINEWARDKKEFVHVLAQSCGVSGNYKNIETIGLMSPSKYREAISSSTLLIGHAGIGTIITAHEYELPLIIVPREYALGEHRNDHQIATAAKFERTRGIYVARTQKEFTELLNNHELKRCSGKNSENRQAFVHNLKKIIDGLLQ